MYNMQVFSKLVQPLNNYYQSTHAQLQANFVKILGICKDFAGNRVTELGNVP